ncbi:phosphate regulon sensor histidine kinase PhoR [Massilia sp. W12]|uniref:phosphate regulon sensor histidine kinase PhoR n=1 Tax=Massilia sp. W12 TaxID=3126507 RepID=UPI0030CF7B62
MNPRVVFWAPVAIRALGALLAALACGYFWGRTAFFVCALLLALGAIALQLHYLRQLSSWLDEPASAKLPDGWGAWTGIFARLYRLRRDDERNQAELSEWLARFRQAMYLLPDGVAIMDDVLFLEWCNPAAEQHLGLQYERDAGMRVTNLVRHPDFIDYIVLGRYEQPLMLSQRERRLVVHVIPFENRRQILVTHDITELDRIERVRRDFIANASHELRTPLTVIVGFLEIALAQPDLDENVRLAHLKLMTEQANRMQNLVADMLTLSRLESVEHTPRSERVQMSALCQQLLQDAQALSQGRHQISLEYDAAAPDLCGSLEELHSAFGNLASNAVRYTQDGGQIVLRWTRDGAGACFAVQDSGIGIEYKHIPRLTERFYRVDKGRSRDSQGTGLGLAIVKHVLLRHHGQLQITSEPGRGSTFAARFDVAALWQDGATE